MDFILLISIVGGIALAFSLSLFICISMLKKSNDFGDSTSTFYHIAGRYDMYGSANKIRKSDYFVYQEKIRSRGK